jgi:hypothetical protein
MVAIERPEKGIQIEPNVLLWAKHSKIKQTNGGFADDGNKLI